MIDKLPNMLGHDLLNMLAESWPIPTDAYRIEIVGEVNKPVTVKVFTRLPKPHLKAGRAMLNYALVERSASVLEDDHAG